MFGNILIFMLIFLAVGVGSADGETGEFYMSSERAEGDPCSSSGNKCRHGTCVVTGKDEFVCACPAMYSGKYCHLAANNCLKCKPAATTECTSFPDGTAVCICLEYTNTKTVTPSVCTFKKKRKPERQRGCQVGDFKCTPGQECVNYAQTRGKVNVVCQCPAGNTRGADNCIEDYKMVTPVDTISCVDTGQYGAICMCKKYGARKDKYGFCKPGIGEPKLTGERTGQPSGKLTGPLNEGDPCSYSRNKCRHGTCVVTGKDEFFCACPAMYSGKYCHLAANNCLKCKPAATTECTSFPDGTAVCICLEYTNTKTVTPSVCTFKKKRRPERQRGCKVGDHVCPTGQECVNYAQDRGKVNLVCQCPAGKTRGSDNCQEEYKTDNPGDTYSCVDTDKHGPICMCKKYGAIGEKYGFCKPGKGQQLTGEHTRKHTGQHTVRIGQPTGQPTGQSTGQPTGQSTGQPTKEPTGQPSAEPSGPLSDSKQVDHCASQPCLHDGVCKQHPTTTGLHFICMCPLGRTGKTCNEAIPDCGSLICRKKEDCISTPAGAVCICITEHQQQMCSVKMSKTTEWEKVKVVLVSRFREVEIYAGITLMFLLLISVCIIRHCIRVSSQRKIYNKKYDKAVKKGIIPTAPLPDWLDISNDIYRQTICCGSSSLPQTFTPKKKKKKKDKKDKTKDDQSPKNTEKQNQNDNSQGSKSRHGSRLESYQDKYPNMKLTQYNDNFQKPDVDNHNIKDLPKTKAECMYYIDSHQPQFAHTSSRGTTQAGTARVMLYPQVHESCNPWIKVERHKKYYK